MAGDDCTSQVVQIARGGKCYVCSNHYKVAFNGTCRYLQSPQDRYVSEPCKKKRKRSARTFVALGCTWEYSHNMRRKVSDPPQYKPPTVYKCAVSGCSGRCIAHVDRKVPQPGTARLTHPHSAKVCLQRLDTQDGDAVIHQDAREQARLDVLEGACQQVVDAGMSRQEAHQDALRQVRSMHTVIEGVRLVHHRNDRISDPPT